MPRYVVTVRWVEPSEDEVEVEADSYHEAEGVALEPYLKAGIDAEVVDAVKVKE